MASSRFINQRIDSMLDNPEFWGGPEAFEFQVILLLELLYSPFTVPQESSQWILDKYAAFLWDHHPNIPSSMPLSASGISVTSIAEILKGFRGYLA